LVLIKVFGKLHFVYVVFMFLYNKTNRCTIFPNLFQLKNEPVRVSGSSSAHHQEFIHCTLGAGISHAGLKTAFEQGRDGTLFHPGPA
jgi:hypothetical protein